MKKVLLPSWECLYVKTNLAIPRKFKIFHSLISLLLFVAIAFIGWNCYNIHDEATKAVMLADKLQEEKAITNKIISENKELDKVQKQFDNIYPLISYRPSLSYILCSLASKDALRSHCYFSKLDFEYNKDATFNITVGMVSQTPQLTQASQDMDNLRTNTISQLNGVQPNHILSEIQLKSYNTTSEPVTRSGEMGGYELSETWNYTIQPLARNETIRAYTILATELKGVLNEKSTK